MEVTAELATMERMIKIEKMPQTEETAKIAKTATIKRTDMMEKEAKIRITTMIIKGGEYGNGGKKRDDMKKAMKALNALHEYERQHEGH